MSASGACCAQHPTLTHSTLKSQSFSRGYGSTLPTSLTHFLPSLEALHLGDLLRLSVRPPGKTARPQIFTVPHAPPDRAKARLCRAPRPSSSLPACRAARASTRKDNSPRVPCRRLRACFRCRPSAGRCGNLEPLPFRVGCSPFPPPSRHT